MEAVVKALANENQAVGVGMSWFGPTTVRQKLSTWGPYDCPIYGCSHVGGTYICESGPLRLKNVCLSHAREAFQADWLVTVDTLYPEQADLAMYDVFEGLLSA